MKMSHSPLCLWKKQILSRKLKRAVSLDEVHGVCNELGFINPEEVAEWLEKASREEIEAVLEEWRRKRKRKKGGGVDVEVYELAYV